MKKLKKRVVGLIILAVFIFYTSVSVYSIRTSSTNSLKALITDVNITVFKIISAPVKYTKSKINEFSSYRSLVEENKKMKKKMKNYDIIDAKNKALEQELQNLKKELEISTVLSEYDILNATVLFRNVGNWNDLITIDKGSNDGVKVNTAIVNSRGLIGKVTEVSKLSSTVELLVNSNFDSGVSTQVALGETILHSYINYYNQKTGYLEMTLTDNLADTNILIDKTVITSGLGGVYPKGIEIGTIVDVRKSGDNLKFIANVRPYANNDNLNYVGVLIKK